MKAIHNGTYEKLLKDFDVLNISKILNESNSQPLGNWDDEATGCSQYFKDTK